MLQGNPFETEHWVQERTNLVQHGVNQQRQVWKDRVFGKARVWQLPEAAKGHWKIHGWWVPAALILGILFGLVVG